MIIGHQKQWQYLKKMAELEKVPHAFLFWGETQVGKRTVALEFIKLLNCQKPSKNSEGAEDWSCQTCQNCQSFNKKIHPDLFLIEPTNKEIQIFQTRELKNFLSLKSQFAQYKSAIIDSAHLLNQEAQNSILKILEEPKGKTTLFLITEYPQMLFPTILSRVQKLQFFSVPKSEIKKYLQNQNLSEKEAKELTELSFGKPGRSIDFLKEPSKKALQKKITEEILKLTKTDLGVRFQYAKELASTPKNLKEILEIWLRYFREILFSQLRNYQPAQPIAGGYSITKLRKILRRIQTINFLISTTNVNPRLALEILMLEL